MKGNGDFELDGDFAPGQIGSDCYVKTGAEAASFQYQKKSILYSPNGTDLVFVQSSTSSPLSKCLIKVRDALGW